MNIRNFFNKIRSINNKELVLPSNLASIPMRDKISIDKIQELSEYKDNYRELLLKNKNLFSNEISIKYFNDEMLMNFNLFSNLIVNHDEIFNLYTTSEYIKKEKYVHRIVNPIKIKLYIDKMHELYEETHLRLIALKELYDEIESRKIIISRHNKEILVNEIYNLTTNYVIFANNVYAALKEVETYRNELQTEINFDEKTRDEIIKNYYDNNVVGQVKASHILIKSDADDSASDKEKKAAEEKAKKEAEDIIKRLNRGEKFSDLAKKYSDDDATASKGGDLGYFDLDSMVEQFSEATKKLKVNEYTKSPVKTEYGYHIILKVKEKKKPKLEDEKDAIKDKLKDEKKSADPAINAKTLVEIRKSKKIKWNDPVLRKAYNRLMEKQIENATTSGT